MAKALPERQTDLAAVFAEEGPRLLRLAGRLMGNQAEAEDVLQEGLLRAQQSLGTFRGECNLAGWVRSIVVNEALHRLRRRRLVQRFRQLVGWQADSYSWRAPSPDPEAQATQVERVGRLYRALECLPARQQVMVSLRYFEQLSVEEIAQLCGVGPGTVKTHLVRALKRLRRILVGMDDRGGLP